MIINEQSKQFILTLFYYRRPLESLKCGSVVGGYIVFMQKQRLCRIEMIRLKPNNNRSVILIYY